MHTFETTCIIIIAVTTLRPGKLDLLFPISHFLNLHASGRSLFIIHYQQLLYRTGKLRRFNWHVIACKATMTDEAAGFRGCRHSFTFKCCNSTGIKNWPQPQVNLPSWHIAKSPRASLPYLYTEYKVRAREWDCGVHTPPGLNSIRSKLRNTTEKGNQGPPSGKYFVGIMDSLLYVSLLSSSKSRPHLSTYVYLVKGRKRAVLVREWPWIWPRAAKHEAFSSTRWTNGLQLK